MNFHLSLYYNRVLKSTQQKYLKIDKKISLFQGFEGIFSFYKCQTPERIKDKKVKNGLIAERALLALEKFREKLDNILA